MTAVVADTHAIVWFLKNSNQLSDHAATAMDSAIQAGLSIYIASISLVEMVYLMERGKIPTDAFEQFMVTLEQPTSAFEVVPQDVVAKLCQPWQGF